MQQYRMGETIKTPRESNSKSKRNLTDNIEPRKPSVDVSLHLISMPLILAAGSEDFGLCICFVGTDSLLHSSTCSVMAAHDRRPGEAASKSPAGASSHQQPRVQPI